MKVLQLFVLSVVKSYWLVWHRGVLVMANQLFQLFSLAYQTIWPGFDKIVKNLRWMECGIAALEFRPQAF